VNDSKRVGDEESGTLRRGRRLREGGRLRGGGSLRERENERGGGRLRERESGRLATYNNEERQPNTQKRNTKKNKEPSMDADPCL